MALAKTGFKLLPYSSEGASLDTRSFLINAATEKVGLVDHAPAAGVITGVSFRIGTITQTDDLQVSLWSVTDDGRPDTLLTETSNDVTVNLAVPTENAMNSVVFDQSYTAGLHERLAVVIEFGTYGAGDLVIVGGGIKRAMFPLVWHDTGAGWGGDIDAFSNVAFNYGGTYHQQFTGGYRTEISWTTSGAQTVEQGLKATAPEAMRIVGAVGDFRVAAINDPITFDFYSSAAVLPGDGVSLLSTTAGLWGAGNNLRSLYMFTDPVEIAEGDTFRVGFDSTGTISMPVLTYGSAALMNVAKGSGLCHYTKSNGSPGTAWIDETTKLPHFSLIIDQLNIGGGGMFIPRRQTLPI